MAERAWPFEDVPEGGATVRSPDNFVARDPQGSEAVVIRIGLNDAMLVLVDGIGRWERWVYHSVDEGKEVAEALRLPVHVGEYPEETRVRMNSYRRPPESFDRAAYPEQAGVGPVIPYPENRPRRLDVVEREAARESRSSPQDADSPS